MIVLLVVVLFSTKGQAQTGVGTQDPENSTALHVTNPGTPSKGVLLAPMTKNERDAIPSPTNGLMIYNLTENCLNYFNNKKWRSLCGEIEQAEVIVSEIQMGDAKVHGTYVVGKPTAGTEFITLPITVTQEGSINITITTGNGYSFSYSNNLISEGEHTITLPATGTPAVERVDQAVVAVNNTDITHSTIEITVGPNIIPKLFVTVCGSAKANGNYLQGQSLDGGNTITIEITSTTNQEVSYNLSTNEIDGISFSVTGVILANTTNGRKVTATLRGTGTPTSGGIKNFIIESNSTLEVTSCPIAIDVAFRKIRLLSNANGNYSFTSGNWNAIFNNTANFGPNGKVKIGGFNVRGIYSSNANVINRELDAFKPDIIQIGYNVNLATYNLMYNYAIANKIPIIIAIESGEIAFLNNIYPGVFTGGGGISGNLNLNAVVEPTDPLKYGPFSPAGVTTVEKDGGGDDWANYNTLPTTIVPYMTNGSSIGIFRDDSKGLIYIPDAGVLNATRHSGGIPNNGNAQFFSNALAWAIEQLRANGSLN